MDGNPWLHDPTSENTDSERADQATGGGAEHDGIGNQINNALGDFDNKLTQLNEELESKRSELADLEDLIATTEKAQAKAFKDLLSKNPQIKKMLGQQKKRSARRRKSKSEQQSTDQSDQSDRDDRDDKAPPMPGQLPPSIF